MYCTVIIVVGTPLDREARREEGINNFSTVIKRNDFVSIFISGNKIDFAHKPLTPPEY